MKRVKADSMLSAWPAAHGVPRLQLGPLANDFVDIGRNAAEVPVRDAGVDVINGGHVVVVDDRLDVAARHGGDIAECVRNGRGCASGCACYRRVQQIVNGRDLPLRRLHRNMIGNPLFSSVQKLGCTCSEELRLIVRSFTIC